MDNRRVRTGEVALLRMPWHRVARRQAGVVTRRQLAAAGLSAAAVTRLRERGQWQCLRRGVFIAAAAPVTYEAGLWAAVLGTGGVLGFGTAAHLWGYLAEAGQGIDVIVDVGNGHRPVAGLRLHRVQLPAWSRELRHGLPITGRTCTLLDHLGRLPQPDAVRLADRALSRSWLMRRDVELRVERSPGRTGNIMLRRLLQITGDGAAAQSERLLHALVSLGWEVLRFTWADLVDRPGATAALILGRCARPASGTTHNRQELRAS